MNNWSELATENRGLAEAIVVLEEYLASTENKKELTMVIKRLRDRFDWTIHSLRALPRPTTPDEVIDPDNILKLQ